MTSPDKHQEFLDREEMRMIHREERRHRFKLELNAIVAFMHWMWASVLIVFIIYANSSSAG